MFMSGKGCITGSAARVSVPHRRQSRYSRFMQPDPIGYEGGTNLYAYVGNDPVNSVDPDGLTPTQRICTGTKICPQHDSGGGRSEGGGRGMFGASGVSYGGHFASVGAGGPATGTNESIHITSAYVWVKDSWGFNLFGFEYGRDVVGPLAEKAWEKFQGGVKEARCAIGKAGVVVEDAGVKVSEVGGKIVMVGAGIGLAGLVTGQPEIGVTGVTVAEAGATTMGGGGIISLVGAGMRAVGGDTDAVTVRGLVNIAGRAISNPIGRSVSTNSANKAAPASKEVPACVPQ
jgi:hypothetical protein